MSLHAMKTTAGFTVTELMITLAVIAVMTGLAAPAFTDFVKNERLVDEANSFILAFILARTESIKRNRRVTLCKSANPDAVTPACTTAGDSNWEDGYIMFNDGNPNAAGGDIADRPAASADGADINHRDEDRISTDPGIARRCLAVLAVIDDTDICAGPTDVKGDQPLAS